MRDQRGEVVTGIIVVMMVVMMIFGGMHLMQRDHRHDVDHRKIEQRHNHDDIQHKQNPPDGDAASAE